MTKPRLMKFVPLFIEGNGAQTTCVFYIDLGILVLTLTAFYHSNVTATRY